MESGVKENEKPKKHVKNSKKKAISIVVLDDDSSPPHSKSDKHNVESKIKRRRDSVTSKAYSFKCALADSTVGSLLDSPTGTFDIPRCPSENIGVRSMSFDFSTAGAEPLGAFEAAAFSEIVREAAYALEVLRRAVVLETRSRGGGSGKVASGERRMMREREGCSKEDERRMMFGEDAGYVDVELGVGEKLLRDRDLVYNVFRKLAYELGTNGSYYWLRCELNAIIEAREKECSLSTNLIIWSDLAKKLRDSQKTFENEFQEQRQKHLEEFNKLAAEIDSSFCVNNEKLDYKKRWEASKLDQQNLRMTLEEKSFFEKIAELEKARVADRIVSKELQSYGESVIKNCEDEIAAWSKRYNEELERRQQEATDLQETIDGMKEFLEESRGIQAEKQKVVDAYNEEQKKIQDEINYLNEVNKAATLIQAIWRGYMVRHRLGPYTEIFKKKPTKKPKKKTKKPKKKVKFSDY